MRGPARGAGLVEVFDFENQQTSLLIPHATLPGQAGGGGYLKASPLPPAPKATGSRFSGYAEKSKHKFAK